MKFSKSSLRFILAFFAVISFHYCAIAQAKHVFLTKKQALEDLSWLKFSLEYVHPRLYKYDNKKTVDARFDSLEKNIGNKISGLDFLALVTKVNATVHCGHLYTIGQGDLGKEVAEKKVLPFYIKVLDGKLYVFNDCSDFSIPNGSHILSINGKSDTDIINILLPGIPADGYIQTRKIKLLERYFFYAFQGFDLYYYLFADRSKIFKIEYTDFNTNQKSTITVKGITAEERKKMLLNKFSIDEDVWFKTPSPKFEINDKKNYAVLTVSRSFYDKKIDPNFDSLLLTAFHLIKERKIENLILDLRNNEGGDEYQQIELMSYLYDKPFKLYRNIYI